MTLTAFGLFVLGVVLAEPLSRALATAEWPARDPVGALLVWQAIGLAGGLALLGSGLVYGLAPLGPSLSVAVPVAFGAIAVGEVPRELSLIHIAALLVALSMSLLVRRG